MRLIIQSRRPPSQHEPEPPWRTINPLRSENTEHGDKPDELRRAADKVCGEFSRAAADREGYFADWSFRVAEAGS